MQIAALLLLVPALALTATSAPQTATGIVTGQILTADGKPAAGVRVAAMSPGEPGASPAAAQSMFSIAETDAAGRYRLESIPPGRYYIMAGRTDAPTYFPGVAGATNARVVTISAGAAIEGVSFAIAPRSSGLRVSGRVNHGSVAPMIVTQTVTLNGPSGTMQSAVAPDGTFDFPRVPPGIHTLRVTPAFNSTQTIAVEDSNITGIELFAPLPVDVTGLVEVDGGGPLPRFSISLQPISQNSGDVVDLPNVFVNSDGALRLNMPSGEYRLTLSGYPGVYRIESILFGATDLVKDPLKLAPTSVSPLRVRFSLAPGVSLVKAGGRVRGNRHTGERNAYLYRSVQFQNDRLTQTTEAPVAQDGSFEVARVLPGTYRVRIGPVIETLTIGAEGAAGLDLVLPPDRQIGGRIVVEGDIPLPRPTQLSLTGLGQAGNILGGSSVPDGPPGVAQIVGNYDAGGIASDGTFKLTLPEGGYRMNVAFPPEYRFDTAIAGSPRGDDGALRIGPDSTTWIVRLTAQPGAGSKVSGQVTGFEHVAPESRRVRLSGQTLVRGVEVLVDPAGRFSFDKIPAGNYTAEIVNGPLGTTSAAVTVQAGVDVSGITLAVRPQAQIRGKVIMPDGRSLDRFTMVLRGPAGVALLIFPPPPLPESNGAGGVVLGVIQPDGTFGVPVPAGEYQIESVVPPAGYVVQSVFMGPVELERQPIDIAPDAPSELRVTLAAGPRGEH